MKRLASLLVLALMAVPALRAQDVAATFRSAPAIKLRTPLQCSDSLNFKGERFTDKNMLQTPVETAADSNEWQQLLTADDEGYVTLAKAESDYLLHRLHTRIRAERFAKGELKVKSTARVEVFVNGESKSVKESVEDSLSKAKQAVVKLRMEPEKDYDIVIKVLSSADDACEPALRCELVKDKEFDHVAVHIDAQMKRRLSLRETNYTSRTSSVSLSPDGKWLLISRYDNYGPNRTVLNNELMEVKSGKRTLHRIPSPAWMPRTNKIYYTVNGKKGRTLMSLDPATGAEEVIRASIPDGSFRWSPDEKFLIYTNTDRGEEDKGNVTRVLMPDDRIPGSRNRAYLSYYDLETGVAERLTYGHESTYLYDISPDGKRLLCASSHPDITKRPFHVNTMFELELATMKVDTLVKADSFISGGKYSPDGSKILVLGTPEAFGGIGKNCGDHPIANDYDVQAFIMDRASGNVEPITAEFDPAIGSADWNRGDNRIYFNTTDKDCKHIYCYDPAKGSFTMLPLEQDVISAFSLAADAPNVAAYIGGGCTSYGVSYLYDVKKQRSTLLEDPMSEILDEIELGQIEPWSFTASDGSVIEGMMCLPPQFDPEAKYPLIVYYYGGTTPTTRGITSPYAPQLFASRDYVVYVINPSGTIGYGQEFSARHVNAWGEYTIDDIIEGTKKFCEEHPFVDDKHIGCLGASYGGFTTMYLQTKTDMFAAAASHAGISNVTSYWGEGYWGYSYNSVAAAESYPWSHPELFTQHGALFNADKINTPLLLLHGTVDTNVPIGESIQLYNALKILGKPVELITVKGENHFISDFPKREQWHNSIMAWFARWLQDSPEWWNDLYPERHW